MYSIQINVILIRVSFSFQSLIKMQKILHYWNISLEGSASYLSIARLCALSLPAAYLKSGEEALDQKKKHKLARSQRAAALIKVCQCWNSLLTASASAGSYHTWMYGWLRASSTEMRHSGSITSILDSRSRAWLAVIATKKGQCYAGKMPRALLDFSNLHENWLLPLAMLGNTSGDVKIYSLVYVPWSLTLNATDQGSCIKGWVFSFFIPVNML